MHGFQDLMKCNKRSWCVVEFLENFYNSGLVVKNTYPTS